jgi:anti-sigma factor RsiW
MDHAKCKENLSAYLDGELPEVERGLVEAHLAGCPDCRAELGQLKAVSGLVKAHAMEPVPASLKRAVLAPAKKSSMPWLKPVLALSAAAAALLVVFNLNRTPEATYSPGFGSRATLDMPLKSLAPAGEADRLEQAAPAAPAAANYAGLAAEADKKAESRPAVAAVRGSLAQAKFAARMSAPSAAGAGGSTAGYKAVAAPAEAPGEFTGPVCVYVSDPGVLREADRATLDALAFLRKACPKTVQAAPGAVFIKKDGTRSAVSARACSYGFILFDGLRDPQVVTDPSTVPAEFRKYFR